MFKSFEFVSSLGCSSPLCAWCPHLQSPDKRLWLIPSDVGEASQSSFVMPYFPLGNIDRSGFRET